MNPQGMPAAAPRATPRCCPSATSASPCPPAATAPMRCATSYDIRAGEILCIVGESGSGKSMSANAIMGLLPDYLTPQQGSILFRGADLLRQDEASLQAMRGKDMAMIFQEPLSALNPLMTVGEQISEVMRARRLSAPRGWRARWNCWPSSACPIRPRCTTPIRSGPAASASA